MISLNPNRIGPILNALAQIWSTRPDMSLADFIITGLGAPGVDHSFSFENRFRQTPDEVLIQKLAEYYQPMAGETVKEEIGES